MREETEKILKSMRNLAQPIRDTAEGADAKAEIAQLAAEAALSAANDAQDSAENAGASAQNASELAQTASTKADEAKSSADSASSAADRAEAAAALAQSTANAKKRVFAEEPTTPYDEGDLWIYVYIERDEEGEIVSTSSTIYVCATSRASGAFVKEDWVLASTDDSSATAIGELVTTLENIIYGTDDDSGLQEKVAQVSDALDRIEGLNLESIIAELENVSSMVASAESTLDTLQNLSSDTENTVLEEISTRKMYIAYGQSYIDLGTSTNYKIRISNSGIYFLRGETEIACIDDEFRASYIYAKDRLEIGDFYFIKRSNGNLSIKWTGGDE